MSKKCNFNINLLMLEISLIMTIVLLMSLVLPFSFVLLCSEDFDADILEVLKKMEINGSQRKIIEVFSIMFRNPACLFEFFAV